MFQSSRSLQDVFRVESICFPVVEKTLLDARLYTSLPLPNEDILRVTGDVAPRNARPSAIFRFLLNGGPWKQVLTQLGCAPLGLRFF